MALNTQLDTLKDAPSGIKKKLENHHRIENKDHNVDIIVKSILRSEKKNHFHFAKEEFADIRKNVGKCKSVEVINTVFVKEN